MPALALTDLANLFGLVKFYTAARGKGVKPVAGADVWIANPESSEDAYRLLLLVRNREGYRQLCELLTKAYVIEGRRDRAGEGQAARRRDVAEFVAPWSQPRVVVPIVRST